MAIHGLHLQRPISKGDVGIYQLENAVVFVRIVAGALQLLIGFATGGDQEVFGGRLLRFARNDSMLYNAPLIGVYQANAGDEYFINEGIKAE